MKILIVFTSHDQLGETGEKTGFWLEEFATPYYVFKDANAKITLASPNGGKPPLDPKSDGPSLQTKAVQRFKDDVDLQLVLANTVKLSDILPSDYDGIFYPGGYGLLWDLIGDKHSITLIESMYACGKPVAAVCHAPAVFSHAKTSNGSPLIKGKSVTSFSNTEEEAVQFSKIVPFMVENELKKKRSKLLKSR